MLVLAVLALFSLLVAPTDATLFLPQAISSNMVLQRAPQSARLWGGASAGSTVTVALDDRRYSVLVQKDGSWSVDFPAQEASVNHTVVITGDGKSVTLTNVAFGDVYICSGQSNMEFSVGDSFDAATAVPDSINYPNLRLFSVAEKASLTPLNDTTNRWTDGQQWVVSQPKYVGGPSFNYFSATCYYFGRAVYRAVNSGGAVVPVGLIDTCWGGTRIEAWTTPAGLAQCGAVIGADEYTATTVASAATRPSQRTKLASAHSAAQQARSWFSKRTTVAEEEIAVSADPSPQTPSVLYNGMIAPLANMAVTGATWYQGEANVGNATNYACRFPAMIQDWRNTLNTRNLYFYFVLLAAYKEGGFPDWPLIRDAQLAALQLPYVGVASAQDLGDEASPQGSIHPRNKTYVGERLAVNALHDVYGQRSVVYEGPAVSSIVWPQTGGPSQTVVMRFDSSLARNRGLGLLQTSGCDVCCNHVNGSAFTVYTSDGQRRRASVAMSDDTVLASVSGLAAGVSVVSVQHNWEEYPQCALYNAARLPLLPLNVAKA